MNMFLKLSITFVIGLFIVDGIFVRRDLMDTTLALASMTNKNVELARQNINFNREMEGLSEVLYQMEVNYLHLEQDNVLLQKEVVRLSNDPQCNIY